MKLMIASDIHGSAFYCEQMIEAYKREGADKLLLLGDILYHGPRNELPEEYCPKKCIEVLKKYLSKIIFIKGNCDAEVDSMVLDNAKFYKIKKIKFANKIIYLTHGHHLSRFTPNPKLEKGSIVLYGHYHVFNITNIDDVTYINIGSTSIPKDNYYQYAIMDEKGIHVHSLLDNKLIGEYLF